MKFSCRALVVTIGLLALVAAGCGDADDTVTQSGAESDTVAQTAAQAERPTIVVTTNILGDVVENLVGDGIDVVTIMPVGADPHAFQASARQVAQIGEADVLIVNGAGFEERLLDVIEAAEGDGVSVFEAIGAVETIEFGSGGHDHEDDGDEGHSEEEHAGEDEGHEEGEHADEGHSEDEHADEDKGDEGHSEDEHADEDDHGHDHEGVDPHFFTDPARMALVAEAIAEFLVANVDGIDADALNTNAEGYIDQLKALDTEVAETLSAIPEERRVLVTNHEVFGYFAHRYDFEVVGTVIPTGTTVDGISAQELAELAEAIEHEGVPAIFADTSSSDELAQTLAAEVGDIAVVELFSESLGADDSEGATYLAMVRTNAQRIVDALAG